jgi:hypothetical protein
MSKSHVEDLRPVFEWREKHSKGTEREHKEWMRRVDESVDNIAHKFGFQVPYAASVQSDYRYVAPYRLELLEKALLESAESVLS